MSVDTAKATGRRNVDYQSLADVVADAVRLSSAKVKTVGNWTPGQIFEHLAAAYNGSIDGLPSGFPWIMRAMAKLFKKKFINGAMPPGVKLPGALAKVVMPPPTSTEKGLADLRAAVERLQRESRRAQHPIFGEITREEWNRVHLNHANLHMSFLTTE
jgi:hypothetical protein